MVSMNCFMFFISLPRNSFMKHMYSSLTPNRAKFARFWMTFATSVSLRAIFSSGYSGGEIAGREGNREERGKEEEEERGGERRREEERGGEREWGGEERGGERRREGWVTEHRPRILMKGLPTLTEGEKTGRQNGRTEEAEKDGATDEFETGLFLLRSKPLANAVQSHLQVPVMERYNCKGTCCNYNGPRISPINKLLMLTRGICCTT